ncbi:MAG: DUF4860 domain-containing protein [Eubacteriales bacterium]|nr:DUF4860 domain-containing protein [Eubacteriales bacterium]
MTTDHSGKHIFSDFFTGLLFGMFLLLFLLLLLFSANSYRSSIRHLNRTQNLYTMASYLENKFRQHDDPALVSEGTLDGIPALLFQDTLDGEEYHTAIYLKDHQLYELFYNEDTILSADLGTPLGEMEEFSFNYEKPYWNIRLTDSDAHVQTLLLHPGPPENSSREVAK